MFRERKHNSAGDYFLGVSRFSGCFRKFFFCVLPLVIRTPFFYISIRAPWWPRRCDRWRFGSFEGDPANCFSFINQQRRTVTSSPCCSACWKIYYKRVWFTKLSSRGVASDFRVFYSVDDVINKLSFRRDEYIADVFEAYLYAIAQVWREYTSDTEERIFTVIVKRKSVREREREREKTAENQRK